MQQHEEHHRTLSDTRSGARVRGRRRARSAAIGLCVGWLPLLAACSSGHGAATAPPTGTHRTQSETGGTGEPSDPVSSPTETASGGVVGVDLDEWQRVGGFQVRAVSYDAGGGGTGARGTRIDVVQVEECADEGTETPRHAGWHLVDAAGRSLGAAGAKLVDGHLLEDIPVAIPSGSCRETELAIGVPTSSSPVAVRDGSATWLLTH